MGRLQRLMIDAIRDLRTRVTELEERTTTVYDRCEKAELSRPQCVAVGPRGGCLITPRHALHAWHYRHSVGNTVRYEWGERKVVRVQQAGKSDIAIATLDEDAPPEVAPAKFLPWDWDVHLPTDRNGERFRRPIRAFSCSSDGTLRDTTLSSIGENFGAGSYFVVSGDSGQPVWLPLAEPVLVGCWLYRGSGPSVAHYVYNDIMRCTALDDKPAAMLEAEW